MVVRVSLTIFGCLAWCVAIAADEPTFRQRAESSRIARDLKQASRLMTDGNAEQAAAVWLRAHGRVGEFLKTADAEHCQILTENMGHHSPRR
jgi:hypothetical protein